MIFVSYHNIDLKYAFQIANLLIRYYRNIWLDRLRISPIEDWNGALGEVYDRATGVLIIVSDDYLESEYCRKEYQRLRDRGIPVTAVIPRDFSTGKIAKFTFDDWIDFRRWFDEPNDLSVENLLNQIPQSDAAMQVGERSEYLHRFIEKTELVLAKLPSAWASLRHKPGQEAPQIRPRAYAAQLLQSWEFVCRDAGNSFQIEDLYAWSSDGRNFVLGGNPGSGKTVFAHLLALAYAHAAMRDTAVALPIWLDLMKWDEGTPSLARFIENEWELVSYWKHWLDNNRAAFFLDNVSDLQRHYPALAGELGQWIQSQADHRFVLLDTDSSLTVTDYARLEIQKVSASLALKYATDILSLEQLTGFRHILRNEQTVIESNHLDFLSIGLELLVADKSLAVNHWPNNPLPALIRVRQKVLNASAKDKRSDRILSYLKGVAWSMMQQETYRRVVRADLGETASESELIRYAIDLGILSEVGNYLRFQCASYQWYLAIGHLQADGIHKYLTRPQFSTAGGRVAQKWDEMVHILVDNTPEETRALMIDQLAEIDPFLAASCLKRHPQIHESRRHTLTHKLIELAAQNQTARRAFRDCLRLMPDIHRTAEALSNQLNRFDNAVQLWLWHEVLALPLDLPLSFVEEVSDIDRNSGVPVIDQFSNSPLSLVVCYLVKLSQNTDRQLRSNAIWMLGQIKYLPSAILLLDYLESGQRDDVDEIALALMNYAYSEILARLLRWSQDNPSQTEAVVSALAGRGRLVSSRLLWLAHEKRLTLNPEFYDLMVDRDELDLAIGMAQIVEQVVELPDSVTLAIASNNDAAQLKSLLEQAIKHLPKREHFELLRADIVHVLQDPPEPTVIAGSNLGALLYGQQRFDDSTSQAAEAIADSPDMLPVELREQLENTNWQQRYQALNNLLDYPTDLVLPHLLDLTSDKETLIRLAAYENLSRYSDELSARKAIMAALSDDDPEVVATVSDLLKSMPDVDCDELLDLLDSRNAMTVATVIEILQAKRYQPALPTLTALIHDKRQPVNFMPPIGKRAAAAITAIKAETAVQDEPHRRSPAVAGTDVAAEFGPPSQLGGQGFTDEEKILRTLQLLRDDDWGRTQKAAKFLRKFARYLRNTDNDKILNLLCQALNDENWHVRWAVAESLAWLENPAAISPLNNLLNDPNWIVQVSVLRALVQLGASDSAEIMIPLLENPQKAVREVAAEALGELRNPNVIPALAQVSQNDADTFVRFAALKSIHEISPQLAREYLEYALTDQFIHLRWYAMHALAPILDVPDIPLLTRLLDDDGKPDWEVESIGDLAMKVLQRINTEESLSAIETAQPLKNRTDS